MGNPGTVKLGLAKRVYLLSFFVASFPVLSFLLCKQMLSAGDGWAAATAAASAALAAFLGARSVLAGLALPVGKVSSVVKRFIAADYKLESVLPKEGWPEAASLISALNRLMLELSAYRAFHLNQIVEERAKAQALIETISDGAMLVDDRGRLIYSNRRALELLGIPQADPNVVLPGSVRQREFSESISGVVSSAESLTKAEVAIPDQENDCAVERNYRVISRQFFLATLKRPGRVIVIRDVTTEKEIESARETFFHMITHDMRAPLSSIQGYAELLGHSIPSGSDAGKYLHPILRSARRLNGMIEDILNTIKLEHGNMTLRSDSIDAGALCAAVFEVYEPLADRKKIKFSLSRPSQKISFIGDALLLDRVLSNLIGNSLKFTPSCGAIAVSCRESSGMAIFCVEDNGPGIPAEKHAEIFEKYTQLEVHKYMGFGLGLAMCKMAVELHSGRIWLESEEGKGSKFYFSVPVGDV